MDWFLSNLPRQHIQWNESDQIVLDMDVLVISVFIACAQISVYQAKKKLYSLIVIW